MSGGWRQHTLRVRLALWYAGAGVAVLVAVAMLALVTGVWVPNKRLDVVLVLLLGLPGAACATGRHNTAGNHLPASRDE